MKHLQLAKHLQITAIVALLLACIMAQGVASTQAASVSGKIVDARTHQPIGGVQVEVLADNPKAHSVKVLGMALSRKDGSFHVSGLPSGQFQIVLTKMGYSEEILSGLSVRPDERTIIGEPVTLKVASEEDIQKMACNKLVRPDTTSDVYVVCGSR